jgi:sterol desaturase/sphingolipid hydroxylase (fatty acid hydroxylase superfamily)
MLVAFIAGVLTWSLLEYLIHRFAGHTRPLVKYTSFGREHTAHHSRGDYFAAWWKKVIVTLAFIALVLPLASLAADLPTALAYTGGLIGFYLTYEVLHRLLHVWQGIGPYARWARRHHFHHHFHDPRTNHGVTSPLWDIVFGTWRRAGRVEVPPKLAMRWLRDPATGSVYPHLARDYALRTR